MSIESMKRISESEAEAVSIRKQAQAEAKFILEQGKKQAVEIVETARKQADDYYREMMRQAEEKAAIAYDNKLQVVADECRSMKAQAEVHVNDAVKIITGKVVNSSVDS